MNWVRLPAEGSLIYQLKISVDEIKPAIWRSVQLSNLHTLDELNYVIQGVLAWEHSHLYEFRTPLGPYSSPIFGDFLDEAGAKSDKGVRVHEVFANDNKKIQFIYDFGDGWEHTITLEKRLPVKPGQKYPILVDGANHAPLEDSGGPVGYMELAGLMNKKRFTEDEKERLMWVGERFDPAEFDIAKSRKLFAKKCKPFVVQPRKPTPKKKVQ